jgi:hypothetical protein
MDAQQTCFLKASIPHTAVTATLGVLLLLTLLPVREVSGQGVVVFNNRIGGGAGVGLSLHIWGPSASYPALSLVGLGSNDSPSGTTAFGSASSMALIGAGGSGGQFGYATTVAQLLGAVGAGQPESALVPVGQTTTFRSGSALGEVAGITVTLTNNPGGSIVIPADAPFATFEIVAWDNSSGLYPTWAQASTAWHSGQIYAGRSAPFTVTDIGGVANVPPYLNNGQGSANGMTSFNLLVGGLPPPGPPSATTMPAADVSPWGATLYGIVYPNGAWGTGGWFEWGATTAYGNSLPTYVNNMCRYCSVAVSSSIMTGLTPGTSYHFRLVAQSGLGTAYGNDESFRAPGPATAATLPATAVTATSATLNGTANPRGWSATAWFEWGSTTNYGDRASVTNLGGGNNDLPLSVALDGLTPGTTYHFRAVAFSSTISAPVYGYGSDQSFTTLMPLIISTGSGSWDAASSALTYAGDANGSHSFILLQSPDPTSPLSAWARVATNTTTPGSFPIPPVGTAAPNYYRVKIE